MPEVWHDLVKAPTIKSDRCVVCGAYAVDNHHIIPRSKGQYVDGWGRVHSGKRNADVPTPTVPLCGLGNTSGCHGKAHCGMLHFRYRLDFQPGFKEYSTSIPVYSFEYLLTDEPVDRCTALSMDGWEKVVRSRKTAL